MKRPRISDLIVIVLFLILVCGSILIVRKHEQKEYGFPIWKTIELGSYENNDAIRKALVSESFIIENWAGDILKKTPVNHEKIKLDLVLISAGQLGFNEWVPYGNILKRAQTLGSKPLPAEVGPQLRLQYPDQPENEWLHIGMEPILDSAGDPTIFDVMHNDHHAHDGRDTHSHHGLQLCSSSVRYDVLWSPSSRWVFAKN